MSQITITGMTFYTNHGVHSEEKKLLSKFSVDIVITSNTIKAEQEDNIDGTINYETIFTLVKTEMGKRVKLIEHLGNNIANSIQKKFPKLDELNISIKKHHPPIGGQIDYVSFKLKR